MSRASPSAPAASDICLPPPPHQTGGPAAVYKNPFDEVIVGEDMLDLDAHNQRHEAAGLNSIDPLANTGSLQTPLDRGSTGASARAAKGSPLSATGGGRNDKRLKGSISCETGDRKPGCCDRPCCQRCSDCCFRCTARCTRVLLVVPNVVFLLFGATLVGLGVWMRADRESQLYLQILRSVPAGPIATVDQIPVAVIAVGSCIAILSFLGCCGACFESVCFLCLYALLLVLMVIAEVAVGVVVAIMQEQVLVNITDSLKTQVRYNYNSTAPRGLNRSPLDETTVSPAAVPYFLLLTTAWDNMHNEFHCCGAVGPEDFKFSAWSNWTGLGIPPSCCADTSSSAAAVSSASRGGSSSSSSGVPSIAARLYDCREAFEMYMHWKTNPTWYAGGLEPRVRSILKTKGCKESLLDQVRYHLTTLIGVVSAVVLLQIVDFGFACVLMNWFRKKQAECSWYDDDDYD